MALRDWLRLSLTEGIGPILTRRLIEAAGDIEAACDASVNLLRTIEGVGTAKANAIRESMRAAKVDEELERSAKLGLSLICPDDQNYPTLLRAIPDPPTVLYAKGSFEPRDLNGL